MTNNTQQQFLQAMGIPIWVERSPAQTEHLPTQNNQIWTELKQRVANCQACQLHCTRTQTVFGVGNHNANLLLIGEAPGAQEDLKGEPFVGRAGQLLDNILSAIGFSREQIYIANILKCRPPSNRDPAPDEVNQCTPFLLQQIELLQPKLIVSLGRISAHYLLNTTTSIAQLRGRVFNYGAQQTPLLVTYHPAYLLRNPIDKRKAWEDWQKIWNYLHEHNAIN